MRNLVMTQLTIFEVYTVCAGSGFFAVLSFKTDVFIFPNLMCSRNKCDFSTSKYI